MRGRRGMQFMSAGSCMACNMIGQHEKIACHVIMIEKYIETSPYMWQAMHGHAGPYVMAGRAALYICMGKSASTDLHRIHTPRRWHDRIHTSTYASAVLSPF